MLSQEITVDTKKEREIMIERDTDTKREVLIQSYRGILYGHSLIQS